MTPNADGSLTGGEIAGVVVASIIGVIVLFLFGFWCCMECALCGEDD